MENMCWICYYNYFWCYWGSTFTYDYFGPIVSYIGWFLSQGQNAKFILIVDTLLEQVLILEGYRSNVASLLPEEIKLEVAYMFRNIEYKNLPPALAIIKPIHSKLDSLEPKRNHSDDIPSMSLRPNLCHGPKGHFPKQ